MPAKRTSRSRTRRRSPDFARSPRLPTSLCRLGCRKLRRTGREATWGRLSSRVLLVDGCINAQNAWRGAAFKRPESKPAFKNIGFASSQRALAGGSRARPLTSQIPAVSLFDRNDRMALRQFTRRDVSGSRLAICFVGVRRYSRCEDVVDIQRLEAAPLQACRAFIRSVDQ